MNLGARSPRLTEGCKLISKSIFHTKNASVETLFYVADLAVRSLAPSTLQFLFFHLSIFLTFPQQLMFVIVER